MHSLAAAITEVGVLQREWGQAVAELVILPLHFTTHCDCHGTTLTCLSNNYTVLHMRLSP